MRGNRLAGAALAAVLMTAGTVAAEGLPGLPGLQNGDLVFQGSQSGQSAAILAATGHPFTHMGLLRIDGDRILVVEAWSEVMATPFDTWIARDPGRQVAIYRDPTLTADEGLRVVEAAERLKGRPYDIFFRFGEEAIYCSELAWIAYAAIGREIGAVERLGDLNIGDARVQGLIEARWDRDPDCAAGASDLAGCLSILRERELVTPASIALDPQLELVFSSFPD